jgi:hypothetical protein
MRAFLLTIFILSISRFAHAQFDFEHGSYLLKNAPELQKTGLLRTGNKNLVVKETQDGKTLIFPWSEVLSYRLGLRRYIRARGFAVRSPYGGIENVTEDVFVELLDSGSVSLMRYQYYVNAGMNRLLDTIYLIQRTGEANATIIPYSAFDGPGKKFREALAPFVTDRRDLVALLNDKKITVYNLQTFIHAFNKKESFLDYPMQGPL